MDRKKELIAYESNRTTPANLRKTAE